VECFIKKATELSGVGDELCEHLWDNNPTAILVVDGTGNIALANKKTEQIFGYTADELNGKPVESLIPQRFRTHHQEIRAEYMEKPQRRDSKRVSGLVGLTKSGDEIHIDIALNPVKNSEERCIVVYIRDLTEQREIEEQHRMLQEQLFVSQKIAALGELTGGIAHDFNNVIATIKGYVSLAIDHTAGKNHVLENQLKQILNASNHAQGLVSNLLAYSRNKAIKSNTMELYPAVIEVLDMLDSILPSSMPITLSIDDKLPEVQFNPVQMQQVMINLCINARDAMSGKGELAVNVHTQEFEHTSCICCGKQVMGTHVVLGVKDDGDGIEPETLKRMFDPLFTTKGPEKGTGMGLSVVDGIVHQHNGHVLVDSTIGEGSTFRILIPPLTSTFITYFSK
jgi:PAS domain S-box-containing protein